jgi:charged multivesicular body protein 4
LNREELREQHAIGQEIGNAITSSVGTEDIDEIDLEDELAELQQEALDEKMLNTGNIPMNDKVGLGRLPNTPQTEVKGKARVVEEDDEEAELRKLQAEMAM